MVLAVLQRLRPVWERTSSLVTPDTLRRWHRELVRRKWTQPHRVTPRGPSPNRPSFWSGACPRRTRLWGYQRIQGELLKVGIEISASSIRRVIAPKRRPGPKRDTWSKFMRTQAASIIACDLFTVESVRLKTLHVLFFIDLHTRRVIIGGVTDGATNVRWCTQIARNLSEARESRSTPLRFLVHDRDNRFGEPFDEVFKAEGVEIIRTPWRAPRANAYAERFVRTVRTECLDRIFVLSERHLESVLKTYINHYNRERPHRGLDLRIPEGGPPVSLTEATGLDRTPRPPRWPYPRIPPEGCVSPSTSTATDGARHGANRSSGSIEARPGFFESLRQGHSPISSTILLRSFSARSVTDSRMTPFRCKCGAALTAGAPREAGLDPSQRPDLGLRLERTTGFEPATPTLARLCSTS